MYNTVNISGTNVWTNDSGEAVSVTLTPLAFYFDMASNVKINPLPVTTASDANGNWTLAGVPDPTPNGSGIPWKLVVQDKHSGTTLYSQDVQPAFSQGTSQQWLSLPVSPPNAGITTSMGPQAPHDPEGPAGPAWMGPWTSTTAYAPSDAVQYQGSTYVATANVTSTSPGSPASPNAPWQLLTHLGATDAPGATGAAGAAGAPLAAHAAHATGATGAAAGATGATTAGTPNVVSVMDAPFNAAGNGVADDTRAIQAAINYATANNAVTYFPSSGTANYRVSQLVIPSGAILQGVSSGTYPGNESIACVSTLARLGGTNRDLLLIPDGNNYCHIRDIQIDGNKKTTPLVTASTSATARRARKDRLSSNGATCTITLATTFTSATSGEPTRF